ncbi:MAG TPA: acyltransferase, partial [Bacteroidia bacterium]|nr:acyltransferase [Bacteroidia bacterium]
DGSIISTQLAGYGVSIFFALSGFLITYLLLEEKKIRPISLKNFYIRRILRIWPLYYMYLLLSLLTIWLYNLPFDKSSTFFFLFLSANIPFILSNIVPLISHYWSIGVEEQFYIFWPWFIKKTPSNRILSFTIGITLLLIVIKLICKIIEVKYNLIFPYEFIQVTRFHCMSIGAIGAVLYFQKNNYFLKTVSTYIVQLISWVILFLAAINLFHIASVLDNEIISLITVFLIIGQIEKKNRIINIETTFFNFLGKISYGIYIIHPLVIFYLSKFITPSPYNASSFYYIFIYATVFISTIFLAYLSYNFYEKRFLNLKKKYTIIKNSDTKQ